MTFVGYELTMVLFHFYTSEIFLDLETISDIRYFTDPAALDQIYRWISRNCIFLCLPTWPSAFLVGHFVIWPRELQTIWNIVGAFACYYSTTPIESRLDLSIFWNKYWMMMKWRRIREYKSREYIRDKLTQLRPWAMHFWCLL